MTWRVAVAVEAIRSRDFLRSCLRRKTDDHDLAEDLLQDAIEFALRTGALADSRDHARNWLLSVWDHRYWHYHRNRRARLRYERAYAFVESVRREPGPRRYSEEIASTELVAAVCTLDPKPRAIALLLMGGMSCERIGPILDIPVSTVRATATEIRRSLRAILAPELPPLRLAPLVTREQRAQQCARLRLQGHALREIARVTGLAVGSVSAYLTMARRQGAPVPYKRALELKGIAHDR